MNKKSLSKQYGISEKDAEEILDDMVAAGFLDKFDADGNPEQVPRTKARMNRVRQSLEDSIIKHGVAQALSDGIAMTENNGLAIKDDG